MPQASGWEGGREASAHCFCRCSARIARSRGNASLPPHPIHPPFCSLPGVGSAGSSAGDRPNHRRRNTPARPPLLSRWPSRALWLLQGEMATPIAQGTRAAVGASQEGFSAPLLWQPRGQLCRQASPPSPAAGLPKPHQPHLLGPAGRSPCRVAEGTPSEAKVVGAERTAAGCFVSLGKPVSGYPPAQQHMPRSPKELQPARGAAMQFLVRGNQVP